MGWKGFVFCHVILFQKCAHHSTGLNVLTFLFKKLLFDLYSLGNMTSQTAKVLLSLDAEAVGSLQEGVNFKKNPKDGKWYIIYKSNNGLKACKNQCKHQGGLFIKDIEDLDGR